MKPALPDGLRWTGVFATTEQAESVRRQYAVPIMKIGNGGPNKGWHESPEQVCHRAAMDQGLPEFDGYYGMDTLTGEFIAPRNAPVLEGSS